MNHKIYIFIFISILSLSCNSKQKHANGTKYNEIVTKYTEIKQILSKEVDDTFYVYVRLPKNYLQNNNRHPVLYLLDGDISFNMATSIVRYLQFGKDFPDLIIVAPAYGTLLGDNEVNHRERDYTFSRQEEFTESGGGEEYLNFIEKELITFVDSNYRTNKSRTLNGYSLGGLFSINVLIRNQNLFDNYIVGSPYLINDFHFINQKLTALNLIGPFKKIFVSVGELEEKETYHQPIRSTFDILKTKSGVKVNFAEFKNGTHFTSPAEALTYGLKFIFNDNSNREP